ncbi:DNA polymerase III subunit delta' [Candidatus Gillettellia adelgis]
MEEGYPWLNTSYHQLIEYYATRGGHHALLLHAAADNGNDALAYALSCWWLCHKKHNFKKNCGACHGCRLMRAGNHPDYHRLIPEKEKNSLGIELIRQVIEKLSLHSHQGGVKVIWLSQAETLTETAANALLKILEEPPKNTYFILDCRNPARLLATLRSRCLYWHLASQDETLSMHWLSHHASGNPVDHIIALRLNSGALIAAKKLLKPERWKQRSDLYSILHTALLKGDILLLLPTLNHPNVMERLHWLCTLLVDAMKWQQGAESCVLNQDQQPLIRQLANRMTGVSLSLVVQHWLICRYKLLSMIGLNRELLLIDQLLSWEQLLGVPICLLLYIL